MPLFKRKSTSELERERARKASSLAEQTKKFKDEEKRRQVKKDIKNIKRSERRMKVNSYISPGTQQNVKKGFKFVGGTVLSIGEAISKTQKDITSTKKGKKKKAKYSNNFKELDNMFKY